MRWVDPSKPESRGEVEACPEDTIETLKEKNEMLLQMWETSMWNFKRFYKQWSDLDKATGDTAYEVAVEVLQKKGLFREFWYYALRGGLLEMLCDEIIRSRDANRKMRSKNRLLSAQSSDEVKEALHQIRQETHGRAERELIKSLVEQNQKLRQELTTSQNASRILNKELDALHHVWCDGGCHGGVHRYDGKGPEGVNEEIVQMAEYQVKRLRKWWESYKHRRDSK